MKIQTKVNAALTSIENAEIELNKAKAELRSILNDLVPQFYMVNGVKVENVNHIWADRQNGIRQPGYELFGTE